VRKLGLLFLLSFVIFSSYAQDTSFFSSSRILNKKRLKGVVVTEAVIYCGANIGLYNLWYKNYPQTSFHFFNDEKEWLQVDKLGHFTTSYYIGKLGSESLRWTGLDYKKSLVWGSLTGFAFQAALEVMDSYSVAWGFSIADMTANTLGTALLLTEGLLWQEQRIQPKFSFHQTQYSKYRPNLLGSSLNENILKDYNGQTYWLSANIYAFLNNTTKFPKWLNIAFGYGADGMVGGTSNPEHVNGKEIPFFERRRQYYLSLDADLTKIKIKSGILRGIFKTVGFIKIPFPALEYTENKGFEFKPLYF
jgi:hypothetical protein